MIICDNDEHQYPQDIAATGWNTKSIIEAMVESDNPIGVEHQRGEEVRLSIVV